MTESPFEQSTRHNRHDFSLTDARVSPYYNSGELLRAKHNATDGAAERFPRWVLGLIEDLPVDRALDAGCGWGRFSVPFVQRRTAAALTCTDLSAGMVDTTRRTITDEALRATYAVADIENLPFQDGVFDVAMANHVLYHMKDAAGAAMELSRVLKAEGRLVATTDSDLVRVPLLEIHRAVLNDLGIYTPSEEPSRFSMENGAGSLYAAFTHVETHIFEHIVHYDAETLAGVYLNTGRYVNVMADAAVDQERRDRIADAFRARAERWEADDGEIASPQRMCAFVCHGQRA